jgi:sugar porter (SP) family MFS transporter
MRDRTTPPPSGAARGGIRHLYRITLVASVGGFLFGYDLSLISGAIIFLKSEWNLSSFWVGAVAGSASLGCCIGPLSGMYLSDRWGRNKALILSATLFIASALGSASAENKLDFSIWRLVGGIGVGLASTISPMYIAEVSPARLRGRLVVINQLAIVVGLALSVYVTYLFSFGGHWRWMFTTMAGPALVFLIGLFFVPQSPRWLAAHGDYSGAAKVLAGINGRAEAEHELIAIREELGEETGGLRELFAPGVRLALGIGISIMIFSQINGVNMILLYAPSLFMEAGVTRAPDAILNSVYLTSWIVVCTVVAFWLTAQWGRRPIIIVGTIAMAAGHVLMFIKFNYSLSPRVTIFGMFLAAGAFTLTLAPLSWVILSELFPTRVRSTAMSLATALMFVASYITINGFPMLLDKFSRTFGTPGGTFLLFAAICLVCSVFVWRALPETKDRTLEEIGRSWLRVDRGPASTGPRRVSSRGRVRG